MPLRAVRGAVLVLVLALASQAGAKTLLILDSESGESIGQGTLRQFLAADGTFTAQRNFDDGVSIGFAGSEDWNVDFAAPGPVDLQAILYSGATRFPFQSAVVPGLSVSGDGRGCNELAGAFQVHEIVYGAGTDIDSFAADFVQYCDGSPAQADRRDPLQRERLPPGPLRRRRRRSRRHRRQLPRAGERRPARLRSRPRGRCLRRRSPGELRAPRQRSRRLHRPGRAAALQRRQCAVPRRAELRRRRQLLDRDGRSLAPRLHGRGRRRPDRRRLRRRDTLALQRPRGARPRRLRRRPRLQQPDRPLRGARGGVRRRRHAPRLLRRLRAALRRPGAGALRQRALPRLLPPREEGPRRRRLARQGRQLPRRREPDPVRHRRRRSRRRLRPRPGGPALRQRDEQGRRRAGEAPGRHEPRLPEERRQRPRDQARHPRHRAVLSHQRPRGQGRRRRREARREGVVDVRADAGLRLRPGGHGGRGRHRDAARASWSRSSAPISTRR